MQTLTLTTGTVLTLAVALALMPSPAKAQDMMPGPKCTAQVSPAHLEAGSEAVQVSVTFSEDIGRVTGVEDNEDNGNGIKMASQTDIPRISMTAGEPAPTPIQMGKHKMAWTLWLNTSEVEEGTHSVVFVAGQNRCTAEMEVVPTG